MAVKNKARHAKHIREYYRRKKEKDPEGYAAMVRRTAQRAQESGAAQKRQRRAADKRRGILNAIKCAAGCADCKVKTLPPWCYDFDHRPGEEKSFSVATNMRRDWAAILDEIAKCDVVCANCHRVRTVDRRREILLERSEAQPMIDHLGRLPDLWQMAVERGLLPQEQ